MKAVVRIADIIPPGSVAVDLAATSKKQALLKASGMLAATTGQTEARIFQALVDRENLGSTGFGRGIAVPHARIAGLNATHAALIRLARPVEYGADDEVPVDLICAIIGPDGATAEPFEALVSACRALRNPETVAKLRKAGGALDLHAVLAEES